MDLIYKFAQSVIKKREKKEAVVAKESENARILWLAFKEKMGGYIKTFVTEQRVMFEKTVVPQFEVGDKAITNYFGSGDGWECSACTLQQHTPYKEGPIEVKIKERFVDSSQLSEVLGEMVDNEYFKDVETYEEFLKIAKERQLYWDRVGIITVHWAYTIKVVGDDEIYWRYTWREKKLLKLGTPEAEETVKVGKKRLEKQELHDAYKRASEKYDERVKKLEKTLKAINK